MIMPMSDILNLYCLRHEERYGLRTSPLKKWFLKHQSYATRLLRFSKNASTCYLTINGEPAAFLSGLIKDDRIIIPRLSIESKFKRYSPGMILINEAIKYYFKNTAIRTLDLSKGEENYKYKLGGKTHKSYRFKL